MSSVTSTTGLRFSSLQLPHRSSFLIRHAATAPRRAPVTLSRTTEFRKPNFIHSRQPALRRFFRTSTTLDLSSSLCKQQASSNNTMASETKVTKLQESDFDEWAALFRQYIDFYHSTIPEEQYRNTFNRILDEKSGLEALVLREGADGKGKMIGLAHFYPHQTPWSEKQICHFNDLYIDRNIRGRGLGRKMMNAVADAAKEMGCFRLEWVTKHDNTVARRLYDTLGSCEFVEYRMPLDG